MMQAFPRHLIGWAMGLFSTVLAVGMVINQVAFDSELLTTEARMIHATDTSDRRIIEQLMDTQRLLIAQQQQQFLTLRREILEQQIELLRQQYERGPQDGKNLLGDRLKSLEHKLENIDQQLQTMILKPKPMVVPDDF